MNHKNVLLLIADDWSPIARCYGNDVVQMPNVDALAARGTVFTNAFCTTPSCAASRANILTGQYSHTHGQYGHCHGIHNFHTHATMASLPGLLREAGVTTGVIGKLHAKPESVYPWDFQAEGKSRDVSALATHASRFFKKTGERPFYLHMGFADPHRDFGNNRTYPGVEEVRYSPEAIIVPDFLPDNEAVRAELAEYYQALSRLDTGIGMAIKALEDAGRREDTLIIVMSDHGMPFPGGKASSFDTGHQCPLIIIRPDTPARSCDALVNWCSIMPTVLDWCGLEPPKDLPELSLLPILDKSHPEGWEETFFSHCFHEVTNYYPYRALRGKRYKYVRNLYPELTVPIPSDLWKSTTWQSVLKGHSDMMGKRPTRSFLHHDGEELFDLENDPMETRNLIDDPRLAVIAEAMRQKVRAFRIETKDPWCLASYQAGEPGMAPVVL